MTKCDCGCGNETGSAEFQKLHVGNELDELLSLESSLHYRDRTKNKEYNSLYAKIEGQMSERNEYGIQLAKLHAEFDEMESQVKGEKLLSEKRRTDGIEMMLEIAKLKEELKYMTETNITCARNGANFAEQVTKLKEELEDRSKHIEYLWHKEEQLKSTLDEIKEYIFADDFVFPCRDMVRDRIKEITNMRIRNE